MKRHPALQRVARPACLPKRATHGFCIRIGFAKRVEVFVLQQQGSRFLHSLYAQRLWIREVVPSTDAKGVFEKVDMVFVSPVGGIEAGVGIGLYREYPVDGDIFGQEFIEPLLKGIGQGSSGMVKVQKILLGVHAGIGPAAANHFRRRIQNSAQGMGHRALNAHLPRLSLPAVVVLSIVSQFSKVTQSLRFLLQ